LDPFTRKGGKEHDVPCHHRLDQYLHDCLETAGIGDDVGGQDIRSDSLTR
jgi:hypothetical protein